MKKFIYIFLVYSLIGSKAIAGSMIPLDKYIKNNSKYFNDPITKAYILKRCAAVYLYAGGITQAKKDISNSFLAAYQRVALFTGKMLMREMGWSEKVASKSLLTDVKNMGDNYTKDGNDSFAKTGKYMQGNYIGQDLKICKGVAETLK